MRFFRAILVTAAAFVTGPTASAQIVWQHTFTDVTNGSGFGFDDQTSVNGTTVGALRRASAIAATNYLNTVLDGRGTVSLTWNPSTNQPTSSTLASFGANNFVGISGTFQNGAVYQLARANVASFAGPDGDGQVNFGRDWHYEVANTNTTLRVPTGFNPGTGQFSDPGTFDLVSVLAHEVGHSLGFSSSANPSTPVGAEGVFSGWDRNMQRGNTVGAGAMFATDITQSNFGTFLGPTSAFTGGNSQTVTYFIGPNTYQYDITNDNTNGLFFNGPLAREVFGGPVPLYAPNPFEPGSSLSHVNTQPIGLMNPSIQRGLSRRFQPYEIAMLLDIGWNTYDWNPGTGTWRAGANAGEDAFDSNWRTDRGIILLSNPGPQYNHNGAQAKAPVLPPHGQVTSNIILNFGGSGSTGYTSTNDLGTVRLARLNLNSTASAANTITGGTLNFGQNSDGSASVLAPKIVQQNSGAFVIASTVRTNNVATQVVTGVTFPGSPGLTVDGPGTGQVTLSGQVTGTGSLTKAGSFTLVLGNNANDYAGGTTVNAGTLRVTNTAGSATGTGPVAVTNAAVLNGTGLISGAVTMTGTSVLAPGDATAGGVGQLAVGGITFGSTSAVFDVDLNGTTAGTQYDRLVVTGGVALNGAVLDRTLGYVPNAADKLFIIVNDAGDGVTGTFAGLANGAGFTLGGTTAYIYYDANFDTGDLFNGNDVAISFSPVPEPAVVLGLAAAGLAVVGLRRRLARRAA